MQFFQDFSLCHCHLSRFSSCEDVQALVLCITHFNRGSSLGIHIATHCLTYISKITKWFCCHIFEGNPENLVYKREIDSEDLPLKLVKMSTLNSKPIFSTKGVWGHAPPESLHFQSLGRAFSVFPDSNVLQSCEFLALKIQRFCNTFCNFKPLVLKQYLLCMQSKAQMNCVFFLLIYTQYQWNNKLLWII